MLRRFFVMLVLSVVLAAGFGTAQAADQAKKPDQFRGIGWGAEVAGIQGLTQVDRDGDIIHYGRAGENKQLGGIPLRYVTYSFYKGRFYHADIGYEGEGAFQAIQRSLEEKYGPPDAVRQKTDASGHPYEVAVWDWPGFVFIGNRHDKDSPRGRIFYFYAPLTDASAKAQGIAPAPAAAPGKAGTYLVQKGDSLSRIAKRQGVTEADLAKANPGLTDKNLKAGATINLPGGAKAARADAPAAPTAVPAPATSPAGPTINYTVKEGDILSKVATTHGVRTKDVITANPGIKPEALRPGSVLRIPGAKAASGQPSGGASETPAATGPDAPPPAAP